MGITGSYLFLNTFVYPIFGQYGATKLRWLAQDPKSPIVKHRHKIFNYVLARNDLQLIIAVGRAAKESVVSWVESRGGACPQGSQDVSRCTGSHLDPHTKTIGVVHPGSASGGSTTAIKADFIRALGQIKEWMDDDPSWLPPDEDGVRLFDQEYKYKSAPIPFRDFPYGIPLRLGRGGTSSNRKDDQRSIQIFSAGGSYNNRNDVIDYSDQAHGSSQGYTDEPKDLPYEPPKKKYREYDKGPGVAFTKLMMGGRPGLEWPDFSALGVNAHPSLGNGPIYRGRPDGATVMILADQQSQDDLFSGRALTGEAGQRIQAYLESFGIIKSYIILRVLPVDTLDLHFNTVKSIVNRVQVRKVYQAIVDKIMQESDDLGLVLTFGSHAKNLLGNLSLNGLPSVNLKAWKQSGALADWQNKLTTIEQINFMKDVANPLFTFDGHRGQIPRIDLPYGHLRWGGTSGDRARRALDDATGAPSGDYYKIFTPDWVYDLDPSPLTSAEQDALDEAD
jgi:hypothetical protein